MNIDLTPNREVYQRFKAWFDKTWPEFNHSDMSAYQCYLKGRQDALVEVMKSVKTETENDEQA